MVSWHPTVPVKASEPHSALFLHSYFLIVTASGVVNLMEEASCLRASRKAHRSHLTRIFRKIEEILQSDAIPNEKQTATLKTSLQQIEAKRATVEELDPRINEDPEALESEILDAEDIQFNVAEKITLIKAVLARSTPLNVQTAPFQPQSEILSAHESLTDDQEPSLNKDEEPLNH